MERQPRLRHTHPQQSRHDHTARSGCVALVVGTILNLINQGDAIFSATSVNWTKIMLT
jgi:hypothetical protein